MVEGKEIEKLGAERHLLILYEDNHLLAVEKPGGLLVQGDRTGDETLLSRAREYLRRRYARPGRVYLGLVHRLDRVTSGVVLLARTSKAAARLARAFREGEIRKAYLAVVEGSFPLEAGVLRHYLRWDETRGRTLVCGRPAPGFREALTGFRVLARGPDWTALLLFPETGRKHQLRAQLAHEGHPVRGDRRYGSAKRVAGGRAILLHALALGLLHPVRRTPLFLHAPLPDYFPALQVDPDELRPFLLPPPQ